MSRASLSTTQSGHSSTRKISTAQWRCIGPRARKTSSKTRMLSHLPALSYTRLAAIEVSVRLRMSVVLAKNRHATPKTSPTPRSSVAISVEFSLQVFLKLRGQAQSRSSGTIPSNSSRKQSRCKPTASKLSACDSTTTTASSSQSVWMVCWLASHICLIVGLCRLCLFLFLVWKVSGVSRLGL